MDEDRFYYREHPRGENAKKRICLNCSKKKCSGTKECFKKEKEKRHD